MKNLIKVMMGEGTYDVVKRRVVIELQTLSGYRRQHRTTTEGVEGVKGHQILPLPFFQRIAQNFLRKSSCSSIISEWTEAEKQEKLSIRQETKVIEDMKANDSLDSLKIPHASSNPSGILAHSLGLHTDFVP